MKRVMNLHPFKDVVATAEYLALRGCIVYQQFNCAHCGTKQTMDKANQFHLSGRCEECGKITDIVKDGCNVLLIASTPEAQLAVANHLSGKK